MFKRIKYYFQYLYIDIKITICHFKMARLDTKIRRNEIKDRR